MKLFPSVNVMILNDLFTCDFTFNSFLFAKLCLFHVAQICNENAAYDDSMSVSFPLSLVSPLAGERPIMVWRIIKGDKD